MNGIRTIQNLMLICALGALSACATGGGSKRYAHSGSRFAQDGAVAASEPSPFVPDYGNPEEITIQGVELENTRFDIPVRINSRVEQWVAYFTGRGRHHFEKYLQRSEHFIPYIVQILREQGMPEDLVYLAMIESGFHNHARSHAKAVGPWQFISATGKRYGLRINWWVDERRDTYKSTLAAIGYLKDLYQMFQAWELAAAAYNAGENKIARAIRRYNTADYWALTRHSFLRTETRDYYPKIVAAALVAKNRTQFGFAPEGTMPEVDESLKLAELDRQPAGEMEPLALPDLTLGEEDKTAEPREVISAAKHSTDVIATPVPTPLVSKKGKVSGEELLEFEVDAPADLLKIARAAGLSYQFVKGLNPEILRWCTPPDSKTYRIKLPASVKDRFLATYNHEAFPREVEFRTYKVRRGGTLWDIARIYGIRVNVIAELNRISPRAQLQVGTKVLLPLPADRSRSLASLDVIDPPEPRRYRRSRARKSVARKNSKGRYYKVTYKSRESARSSRRSGDGT